MPIEVHQPNAIEAVNPHGGGHGGYAGQRRRREGEPEEGEAQGERAFAGSGQDPHAGPAIEVDGILAQSALSGAAEEAFRKLASQVEPMRRRLIETEQRLETMQSQHGRHPFLDLDGRQGFMAKLARMLGRVGGSDSCSGLILVHVANGDAIRLAHGRSALDAALGQVADVLNSMAIQPIAAGCLGGNDFAVAVIEASPQGVHDRANQIQSILSGTLTAGGEALMVRTGTALLTGGMTAEAAVAAADRDLI